MKRIEVKLKFEHVSLFRFPEANAGIQGIVQLLKFRIGDKIRGNGHCSFDRRKFDGANAEMREQIVSKEQSRLHDYVQAWMFRFLFEMLAKNVGYINKY
jgi:hypothetical protein